MNTLNRGSCYYCGEELDRDDLVEISPTVQVGCCRQSGCQKQLNQDRREAYEEAKQEAAEQFERNYWG